jgi:hypothetical protein
MQRTARRYTRITSDDSEYPTDHDPRFDVPESMNPKLRKPSKKTIALAFGLLFVGSVLLTCYALYATGKGGGTCSGPELDLWVDTMLCVCHAYHAASLSSPHVLLPRSVATTTRCVK